ncbi:alpha-D-ribose 1-methylphosphonate 5-triphosphate synthase subunit PhnI [Roseovarius sp. MBR-78]|uniref:carbon-phosphorus lyase complex subunit PhnI n=1 Tax=Roseovarius sp. MBR-78 TaxID=3156460 RepID=UPI003399E5C2
MAYVAIRGGADAIKGSSRLMDAMRAMGESAPLELDQIERQMPLLHSKVLSEGSLYHPRLASLALKQSLGDSLEAAFFLRAYRSTKPRLGETAPHDTRNMRVIRRVSAAFKDIPGGQMLGATPDYLHRLFRFELMDEGAERFDEIARDWLGNRAASDTPLTFPKVLDSLRDEGLLAPLEDNDETPFDITREPLIFPVPRSAQLATMARGETGGLLALAYSNMRGYGDVHPTVGELRVGYVPVMVPHPVTGKPMEAGEVLVTECEIVAMFEKSDDGAPVFTLGYGACFGHNEVKAIAMSVLDRAISVAKEKGRIANPSEDPEFVLLHVDGIESMGFCTHYKMPHYVTFQSDMDRLRAARGKAEESTDAPR